MLNSHDFTNDSRVIKAVEVAKKATSNPEHPISDIIDDEGNQYVDLVMEGGGVLGVALIGYTYVLEQAGIRFLGIGGASVGAINALMLAALGPPQQAKSEALLDLLSNMPLSDFIDGDSDAQDFCNSLINGGKRMSIIFQGLQILDNLGSDKGLNPGVRFNEWLVEALQKVGVHKTRDLNERLSDIPSGLQVLGGSEFDKDDYCFKLALVASDITTETKVEFPKMACLYWEEPEEVCPADYVRASISIPFFFHPVHKKNCPSNMDEKWRELAGYYGTLPSEVLFVDGGVMSNFPIDIFHKHMEVPKAPTFGAKLGPDRSAPRTVSGIGEFTSAVFDAARHAHDFDFINRNPDYRLLMSWVNTNPHYWLNFNLTDSAKIDLFVKGAEAAAGFLENFRWDSYKALRASLASSFLGSLAAKSSRVIS